MGTPLSAAQVEHYREEGFLVLPKLLAPGALEALLAECMAAWEAEKGPFDPSATWLHNALLPNIHDHSKLVQSYYFDGPLVAIAEQLVGPNLKGATSQLTFKIRGNDAPPLSPPSDRAPRLLRGLAAKSKLLATQPT
mgnify:CR=1 FL=1